MTTDTKTSSRSSIARAAQAKDTPAKPYEVRADKPIGLLLRVQPTGRRTFYVDVSRGKRIRIGPADVYTLQKAQERARAILLDPTSALPTTLPGITLGEYIDGEFKAYIKPRRRDWKGTLARIKAAWPSLLDKRMEEITGTTVDVLRTKRLTAGTSMVTVNRDLAALSSAFTHWAKHTPGKAHPLHDMEVLDAPDNKRVRYLSADEWQRLLKALDDRDVEGRRERESYNAWLEERGKPTLPPVGRFRDHITPMALLALNTGMRRGEVFSLKWDAVNFDKRLMTVTAVTAKTKKTRRIPLNDEALEVLQEIKPLIPRGLVFPSPVSGKKFDNISKAWGAVVEAAELEDFHWHDLRHTFASWMVIHGESLYKVQVLMGHGSSLMTSRYAHLEPEHLAEAVSNVRPPTK